MVAVSYSLVIWIFRLIFMYLHKNDSSLSQNVFLIFGMIKFYAVNC